MQNYSLPGVRQVLRSIKQLKEHLHGLAQQRAAAAAPATAAGDGAPTVLAPKPASAEPSSLIDAGGESRNAVALAVADAADSLVQIAACAVSLADALLVRRLRLRA